MFIDELIKIDEKPIIDENGYLVANATIARIGIQKYNNKNVFRPKEEVFDEKSYTTFENKPLTIGHPQNEITIDNHKYLAVGFVRDIKPSNNYLTGKVIITDKKAIDLLKNGIIQLSAGYDAKIVEEKGIYDGIEYDYKQTNIVANHIAIVPQGRCSDDGKSVCKIKLGDSMDELEKIKQTFNDTVSLKDKEIVTLKDSLDKEVANVKTLKDSLDKVSKEKESLSLLNDELKKQLDKVNLDLFKKEIKVIDSTLQLDSINNVIDIKKAFIMAHIKDCDLTNKDNSFIDGMFEVAKINKKSQVNSLDGLKNNISDSKPQLSAFEQYKLDYANRKD